jgi:hypothetical protein
VRVHVQKRFLKQAPGTSIIFVIIADDDGLSIFGLAASAALILAVAGIY